MTATVTFDSPTSLAFALELEAEHRGWDVNPTLWAVCDQGGGLTRMAAPGLLWFTEDSHSTETLKALAESLAADPGFAKRLGAPAGFVGLAHVHEGWGIDNDRLAAALGLDPSDEGALSAAYSQERQRRGGHRFLADMPGAVEYRYAQVVTVNAFGIPQSVMVMRGRGEEPELLDDPTSHGGELDAAIRFIVGCLFAARSAP